MKLTANHYTYREDRERDIRLAWFRFGLEWGLVIMGLIWVAS